MFSRGTFRLPAIELREYSAGMTHLKAMLIDDAKLVLGSSNFDFLSFRVQKELIAIIKDPPTISAFKRLVMKKDIKQREPKRFKELTSGNQQYLSGDTPNLNGQIKVSISDPTPCSVLGYYPSLEVYRD